MAKSETSTLVFFEECGDEEETSEREGKAGTGAKVVLGKKAVRGEQKATDQKDYPTY